MESNRILAKCEGHEELKVAIAENNLKIDHLTDTLDRWMLRTTSDVTEQSKKIEYLQIYGSKETQDNTVAIKEIAVRVDDLEAFKKGHDAAQAETTRIAAIIAGTISVSVAIVTVVLSLWQWGRP